MSKVRHDECQHKAHYFGMFLQETQKPCQRTTPAGKIPPPRLDWDWESGPCSHIGDTLRSVPCKPCSGRREVEIKACTVHGECSWSKGIRSEGLSGTPIKSCRHCEDYSGTEAEDASQTPDR